MVHHDWFKPLINGGQVDVVFIDFAKAFDLVNHSILLNKLYMYGVRGRELLLKGSDWLTVTSSAPQGSLLGPLFFIIYIDDLAGVISKESSFALYADDSKLYRIINVPEDISSFQ